MSAETTVVWARLESAGIDITRVFQTERYDNGPEYLIRNGDGSRVAFGEEFEGGESQGWTYCAYDEEDGVIENSGEPTLEAILPRLVVLSQSTPAEGGAGVAGC